MLSYFRRLRSSIRRRLEGIITRVLCRFPKSQFLRKCFIRYCGTITTGEIEVKGSCDFDFHSIVEKYVSGLSSDRKAELIEFINNVTKKKDGKALGRLHMLRCSNEPQDIEYANGDHVIVASKSDRDAAARRISMRVPT